MKFSLSTNWCNRRMASGEEIADKAMELGFEGLELGFHTTDEQVKGFKRRLSKMPVGSIHAFCPVPLSAPQGYPELYALASFDAEARAMARFQVLKNVRFAAEMGASAVVLHAGRVMCPSLFKRLRVWKRTRRGLKMVEILKRELEALVPELEKHGVVLGLENLPYYEGFPNAVEMPLLAGDWVKAWFDTGHDVVIPGCRENVVGLHVNDSEGGDDHLAPGMGKIDFAKLRDLAFSAKHLVLEPNMMIPEADLKRGLELLKKVWA